MSIRLSDVFIRWVIEQGTILVRAAYGNNYNPRSRDLQIQEFDEVGFYDAMPHDDPEVMSWVEAMILFVRTITSTVTYQSDFAHIPDEDLPYPEIEPMPD